MTVAQELPIDVDHDDDWDDEDDCGEDYGLDDSGQCSMAGTEHCDFVCPYRDSDLFASSRAWCQKHGAKIR